MRHDFTYRGVLVSRNTSPGYALRWSARLDDGRRVAADTQEGIKAMIRDALARP